MLSFCTDYLPVLQNALKHNELNRRLVTALPFAISTACASVTLLHASASHSLSPTLPQPISDRTLSPLTVPGIHPLRATCHIAIHYFNAVFHITQNARVRIDEVSTEGKQRPSI